MTVIGYARVSTGDQNTDAQKAALGDAGCVRIFTDRASGAKADRPQLAAALDYLNPGDTLVVWRLDRLGRSLTHLVEVVHELGDRDIEFRSLTEAIDTTTPSGRLLFHVAAAFAEFERDLIRERTRAGLAAAREAGRFGGRPTVMTPDRIAAARALVEAGKTHSEIVAALGVSLSSLRRALRGENKGHRLVKSADANRDGGAIVTPYALCQRYADGLIDRAQVVDELTRFPYVQGGQTDGHDSLIVDPAGTWAEVSVARRRGLIEDDVYEEVFNRRHGIGAAGVSREGWAIVTQMPPTGAEDWLSTEPHLQDWDGPRG